MAVRVRRNSTTGVVPDPEILLVGELAVNTADAKLWTKHSNGSLVDLNPSTWDYFVTNWSAEPTLNTTIIGGEVYNYTLNGTTRYRFVPTMYNPTQDAFYSTFDGANLTNLITKRG